MSGLWHVVEAVSKRGFGGDAGEPKGSETCFPWWHSEYAVLQAMVLAANCLLGSTHKQECSGQWWPGGQRNKRFSAAALSSLQGMKYTRLSI